MDSRVARISPGSVSVEHRLWAGMASSVLIDWTAGEQAPLVMFPSGEHFELWEGSTPHNPTVHLFGTCDLALRATRDLTLTHLQQFGDLRLEKVGETQLEVAGNDGVPRYLLTFDDLKPQLVNVERIPVWPLVGFCLPRLQQHARGFAQ